MMIIKYSEALTSQKDWVINFITRVIQAGGLRIKGTSMAIIYTQLPTALTKGLASSLFSFYICFCFLLW